MVVLKPSQAQRGACRTVFLSVTPARVPGVVVAFPGYGYLAQNSILNIVFQKTQKGTHTLDYVGIWELFAVTCGIQ